MKIKGIKTTGIVCLSLLLFLTAWLSVQAQPQIEKTTSINTKTQPGVNRFKLGAFDISVISDGTVPQDLYTLLRGSSKSDIDQLLINSHLSNPVEASINSYLINTGNRLILVDTGAGS